jgi:MscS family membrane protein
VSFAASGSFLFRPGPLGLLGWQWLALPLVFLLAWLLGSIASRITRAVLARVVRRTSSRWDDAVVARIGRPLTVGWAIGVTFALLVPLQLGVRAEDVLHRWLKAAGLVVFFWALSRIVDVAHQVVARSRWIQDHPTTRGLLQLGSKLAQIFLLATGVVALLSELGYPVASLVAGLGIGGLAVALAAQKTLENLFGALALGADQPFREGDFVNIEGLQGTVESIGLRSTRLRTPERTLITIPNGKLAEMRLETFAVRDRLRFYCTIGLVLSTTAAQLRNVLDGVEAALRGHAKAWPEGASARLKEIGAHGLVLEVNAYFATTSADELALIREQMLIEFLSIIERSGTALAIPANRVELIASENSAPAASKGA